MVVCAKCREPNAATAAFCAKCGAKIVVPDGQVEPTTGVRKPNKQSAVGKNPWLALVLSLLIVGLGQFYNGDYKKGALMLLAGVLLFVPTSGLAWAALMIWSAIDAYKVAKQETPLWM